MFISEQIIETLCNLPKINTLVFPTSPKGMKVTFSKARKRLAQKLDNPRLLQIHFHTLRHWKATILYHQTKGAYYVQRFLGHKSLRNTEIYINIEHALFPVRTQRQIHSQSLRKPKANRRTNRRRV